MLFLLSRDLRGSSDLLALGFDRISFLSFIRFSFVLIDVCARADGETATDVPRQMTIGPSRVASLTQLVSLNTGKSEDSQRKRAPNVFTQLLKKGQGNLDPHPLPNLFNC